MELVVARFQVLSFDFFGAVGLLRSVLRQPGGTPHSLFVYLYKFLIKLQKVVLFFFVNVSSCFGVKGVGRLFSARNEGLLGFKNAGQPERTTS